MARIAGVDIPRDKRVSVSLRYIYGIGISVSNQICTHAAVAPETKVRELTDDEISRIREYIDRNFIVEGELRRRVRQNIQRPVEKIGTPSSAVGTLTLCDLDTQLREADPVRTARDGKHVETRIQAI